MGNRWSVERPKGNKNYYLNYNFYVAFFNGYSDVMWKGGLKITFKRNNNDNMACHVWGSGMSDKVAIKSLCIRMPIVMYHSLIEIKIKDEYSSGSQTINFVGSKTIRKPVSSSSALRSFHFNLCLA